MVLARTPPIGMVAPIRQPAWTVACTICGAQRGERCHSLATSRALQEGHTLRIWSQREWDVRSSERHP